MNTKIKTLLAATALSSLSIAIAIPTFAANQTAPAVKLVPAATQMQQLQKPSRMRVVELIHAKKARKAWNLGFKRNLRLSPSDAKTITKAALLMKGRKHLDVGKIENLTGRNGQMMYRLQIVNKKNHVVKSVILNSRNGHIRPLQLQAPRHK